MLIERRAFDSLVRWFHITSRSQSFRLRCNVFWRRKYYTAMHLLKQWLRIFWIHVNSCASIKLVEVVFGKRQPGCLPQLSVTCRRRICPLPTAKLPSREPGSAGRRWEPWPTRRMSSGSGTRRLALCRAAIQTWYPGCGIWRMSRSIWTRRSSR